MYLGMSSRAQRTVCPPCKHDLQPQPGAAAAIQSISQACESVAETPLEKPYSERPSCAFRGKKGGIHERKHSSLSRDLRDAAILQRNTCC